MTAFQTFLEKISKGISEYYGEAYQVEISRVRKNNGVIQYGITISCAASNISPTIYMEAMYREYRDGQPLSEIMKKVIQIYEAYKIEGQVDMGFFLDFAQVKEKIVYKLIGYENNRELLYEVPHIRFLDIALVCYLGILHDTLGSAAIAVKQDMCRMWKVEKEELFELAKRNTQRILMPCISDIRRVLGMPELPPAETEEAYMYVLTNNRKLFGAACILYPHVLQQFAQRTERNFYILPSSVHEVLLVPERPGFSGKAFEKIVQEMNRTQVSPEEVLSDSVYYYDREKKKLRML